VRLLVRYIGVEMIALHALTGALFLFVNVVVFAAVWQARPWIVLVLLPFAAFNWWGWWAEGRFVVRAMRALHADAAR
jgi:hypothetical protein